MKRKLEQLNLLDDFLFGSILSYPEIGEEFCRKILKILLNVDMDRLHIVPQKVYYGSDTDRHGARLDVYIEEEKGTGTIYDVEPDKNDDRELKLALPRRVRFYHSKIDGRSLKAGDDYSKLKQVIVLRIMSYDPFGRDRVLYTIRSKCEEDPDMDYDDGAATCFFYTKGKKGELSEEARELLRYMEDSSAGNAQSERLKEIHSMVETVRQDEEVALEYMKVYEREQMIERRGEKIGERRGEIKVVRNMSKSMTPDQISEASGLEREYIQKILMHIRNNPEESDAGIAARILAGD
ncbi:Rpn family recombination-promoting nuclease/putative transposase [Schaedlerella arabinosiphila]|uniref:Rpn family recombination-promoting nuclease/putative transposase n=1 Tax=Schaedlerella arabinosiphila TaxID=2044587 RepID=A0A426DD04_9FIRM|nr:Rpn family recombination-promoting nuclease/putative transposase [Schaedlerella arabinosiphila]RRK30565.1 Rpn family recombination-promoting nuclease/putative transposase [Schaedlerella arabinosiphila]